MIQDDLKAVQDAVLACERAGDLIEACDRATRGLEVWPGDLTLRYLHVLALARAGATGNARAAYRRYDLAAEVTAPAPFNVDLPALAARLEKDHALSLAGRERRRALRKAAEAYYEVYRKSMRSGTGNAYYPAINAAALYVWSGNEGRGRVLARKSLVLARAAEPGYWSLVTQAEAFLLLRQERAAESALAAAMGTVEKAAGINWQQVATTRRQLRRTCVILGLDPAVLSPLRPPGTLVYSGHMIGGRFDAEQEGNVAAALAKALDEDLPIAAFGSLAGGADILVAEALIARNVEVHVALPFGVEDFKAVSVHSSGTGWSTRFDACLARAASVHYVDTGRYLGDPAVFGTCARLSMGRALLRAEVMDSAASMLAVWDGAPAGRAIVGTSADVEQWRQGGRAVKIVHPGQVRGKAGARPAVRRSSKPSRSDAAVLFGDLRNFSQLDDSVVSHYVSRMLGTVARVLKRRAKSLLTANSWGDAFFAAIGDVEEAARCAWEIQHSLGAVRKDTPGAPGRLRMRIGAHFGPVLHIDDPISGRPTVVGTQVVRAARIEPVTEPGMIWVTESFAAALALVAPRDFVCAYLGQIELAKLSGRQPLFLLRRSTIG